MELDFIDDSDNVGTVTDVEVLVHQEPVRVTSAILLTEQAPTQHSMVLAAQCVTVLTCRPLPLQGTSVGSPLVVQSTSVGVPMLIQGTVFPPVTRAPIHMQGPTFWTVHHCLFRVWQGSWRLFRARHFLVHTWLLLVGLCISLVSCLGPRRPHPLHFLNVTYLVYT